MSFKVTGWFFWIYFLNKLLAAAAAAPLNGDFFFFLTYQNKPKLSIGRVRGHVVTEFTVLSCGELNGPMGEQGRDT